MNRRETTARRNASATAARPTKRSWAVKKAERESEFPARIEDATPEQIAKAVFAATDVRRARASVLPQAAARRGRSRRSSELTGVASMKRVAFYAEFPALFS